MIRLGSPLKRGAGRLHVICGQALNVLPDQIEGDGRGSDRRHQAGGGNADGEDDAGLFIVYPGDDLGSSTNTYSVQVSVSVLDDGKTVGVLVVGLQYM